MTLSRLAAPCFDRSFDLPGGIKITYGFTSVQVSDLTDKVGNIVLGNQQYTISEEPNVVNVVLVHHPLDWFIDKTEALQHLQNSARAIMVGTSMRSIFKTTDAFYQKEWLVIYAGATNRLRRITTTLTIGWSFRVKKRRTASAVEVFPRVWFRKVSGSMPIGPGWVAQPNSTGVELKYPVRISSLRSNKRHLGSAAPAPAQAAGLQLPVML